MTSPEPRFPWLVPAAMAIAVLAGSSLAVLAAILGSPTQTVGAPLTGLDTRFLAIFFGAPAAGLVAAVGTYYGSFTHRPVSTAIVATVAAIVVACVIGFEAEAIGNWWLSSLPSDTNQTSAIFTVLLTPPVTVSVGLALEALRGHPTTSRRSHFLGLLTLSIFLGLFIGAYVGSVASALTLSAGCSVGIGVTCGGFGIPFVIEEGGLFGSWLGAVMGAISAGVVWRVRVRTEG
jgi:hypothetical protein